MTDDALRRLATAQMQRGRDLVADGGAEALQRAVVLFDRAVAVRRGLAARGSSNDRYDLAGAWLNKAEALHARGPAESAEVVRAAYDSAVALLRALPLDDDARFRRRLAVALQNRALIQQSSPTLAWRVLPDLFHALDVLRAVPADAESRTVEASLWNLVALAQLREPDAEAWRRALASATLAVNCTQDAPGRSDAAVALSLCVRHTFCRAAGRLLTWSPEVNPFELVHRATDVVEGGLRLLEPTADRRCPQADVAMDLFHFGRSLYERYQPQFAAEFTEEFAPLFRAESPLERRV